MANRLANKRCLIVGGTTGLGLSAARACVAAGARVVVVGRDPDNAEAAGREFGEAGLAVAGDATGSSMSTGPSQAEAGGRTVCCTSKLRSATCCCKVVS